MTPIELRVCLRQLRPTIVFPLSILLMGDAFGQSGGGTLSLHSSQSRIIRLAPDAMSEIAEFQVDTSTTIDLEIASTIFNTVVSVSIPGGGTIDSSNIEAVGGILLELDVTDAPLYANVVPHYCGPVYQHLYRFPSQGTGLYQINIQAPPTITEDEAVLVYLDSDSTVQTNLVTPRKEVFVGDQVAVSMALFDGDEPILSADAMLTVMPPGGGASSSAMLDNGEDADYAIGDGLYSVFFVPDEAGVYALFSEATGEDNLGIPFARQAGTEVLAVNRCAVLDPPPTFSPVDDDSDSLYERLDIEVDVDVTTAATFILQGILTTPSGKTLHAYGMQALPVGSGTLVASVRAEDVVALAENGPYTLTSLELYCETEEGALPSDRLLLIDLDTAAYSWTDFEREPIRLTDVYDDMPLDIDFDCQMRADYLSVEFEIIVSEPGIYHATARLYGTDYQLIAEGANGQVNHNLPANVPVTLAIWFSAADIYLKGIDGPYRVRDLILSGQGHYLLRNEMVQTQAYDVDIFEPYPATDCNNNDIPDECDIQTGTSSDCQDDNIPDDCQLVGNDDLPPGGDGIPDDCNCTTSGECDDGDTCNGFEFCSLNLCQDGFAPICPPDQFSCTEDVCDPILGCLHIPHADWCSTPPQCKYYTCTSGSGCVLNLLPDGTCCDDDKPNTYCDKCTGGACKGSKYPVICSCDGNPED